MSSRRGDSRPPADHADTGERDVEGAGSTVDLEQSVDGSSSDASASNASKNDEQERSDGLLDTAMLDSTKWQYYKKQQYSWYWQF